METCSAKLSSAVQKADGGQRNKRAFETNKEPPSAFKANKGMAKHPFSALESGRNGKRPEKRTPVQRAQGNGISGQRGSADLPFYDRIQTSFGHHDYSQMRVSTQTEKRRKALGMGAEAFAVGQEVVFSRTPSLFTAAHEAAHVIQQGRGVASSHLPSADAYERHANDVAEKVVNGQSSEGLLDATPGISPNHQNESSAGSPSVIRFRRLPPNVRALLTSSTGGKGANFAANAEGALILIDRAMEELTPAERAKVKARLFKSITEANFNKLPRLERRSRWVEAILAEFPVLEQKDPNLNDTGPRPATSDAANLAKVVGNADKIFNDIATGSRDAWLKDVFGAANITTAKDKYKKGRTWMNFLHSTGKIVTDRSGYATEVFQGGLTGFQDIIRVESDVIDKPDDHSSIVTLLHESMHAGNSDVSDDIYNGSAGFQTQGEAKKLTNSAHFEVVPWRILDPTNPSGFPVTPATTPPTFQTFVPAGTTIGGVSAPARTPAEEGAIAAYDRVRSAWALGLNLNLAYLHIFKKPGDWTIPLANFGGQRPDKALPFWSKVQKLTIHLKTAIDPASADMAKHPVTQIDMAISEGVIRRLGKGMDILSPLDTEAKVLKFEKDHSSASELSTAFPGGTHTNADKDRDFLLKLTVRDSLVGPITGNTARDLRVVAKLGDPSLNLLSDIFAPRNPSSFAD